MVTTLSAGTPVYRTWYFFTWSDTAIRQSVKRAVKPYNRPRGMRRAQISLLCRVEKTTGTPEARAALKGLIAQAFHGTEEVATPVHLLDLAPDEDAYIRLHAMTAVPSTMPEPSPWALEGWRHTTLATMLQPIRWWSPAGWPAGS